MRNSSWWFNVGLFTFFAVAGLAVAVWDFAGAGTVGWKSYAMIVAVPLFVTGAVLSWRAGVRVTEWGVVAVAELSVRRIAWADVEGFEVRGEGKWNGWVAARRQDGSLYKLASPSATVRQNKLGELKNRLDEAQRRCAPPRQGD